MNPKISETLPVTIWQQAIGEILGFMNGARTQKELENFGCYWWKSWVTKEKCEKRGLVEGDLGPGSYGAAFHDFPTSEGQPYNQIKAVVQQNQGVSASAHTFHLPMDTPVYDAR